VAGKPSQSSCYTLSIAGLVGKAYLKSATAVIATNGFRKTGLFPSNRHIFDEHDFLGESQRNITSCLLENPVPCTSSSEEPPHKTRLLLFYLLILVLFLTSLTEDMKKQKTVTIPGKDLLLF
jgi:hypothetical protein